jgi:large subunit ribosomal protein L10
MSKYVKSLLQAEFEKKIDNADIKDFLVVSTKGIDGVKNNQLRGQLKQKEIGLFTVRNALFKRALADKHLEGAGRLFEGPCAVIFGHKGADIVEIAKEVADWRKKLPLLEVKGAYLDGSAIDSAAAESLSKMPTRSQLKGQVVMLMNSPGARLSSAITSVGSLIAGCIKTIIEKQEEQEKQAA